MEHKPGDVVNGHLLGTDGQWHPISYSLSPQELRANPMKNALGGWSLAVGIASMLFFWVPVFGMLTFLAGPIGIVLGHFGRARADAGLASNRGVATAGMALSAVALALAIIMAVAIMATFGSFISPT